MPTMGALHQGHLSLVEKAQELCDVVVVSIFVNPTQFNNPEDLNKYPRQEEQDLALLEKVSCDFVYLPNVEEIYPADYIPTSIDLGDLEMVMEGKHRPGHFQGVVNVVSRLFHLIQPNVAFFGKKDFQQVAVIERMVKNLELPIRIEKVPTKRSNHGLALSSRNALLSEKEKKNALVINNALTLGKELAQSLPPYAVQQALIQTFEKSSLDLEYLQIVHPVTLKELHQYWVPGATVCIAAYCGKVRLIDNLEIVEK